MLAGCAAIGSLGAYYAVFSVLLFVVAGAVAAIARRSWRPVWSAAILTATVGVVLVVNIAPSILHRLRQGANPETIVRFPSETEIYGLRIQQLFAPRLGHRNGTLSRWADKAYSGPVTSELGQTLGVLAAAGVLVLLGVVLVGLAGDRRRAWWDGAAGRTLRHAGVLVLVVILFATISGFAYFLSVAGMRDIRAWNRSVVVIGFLGLLALAVLAERWAQGAEARRGRRWTRRGVRRGRRRRRCSWGGTTRRPPSTGVGTCERRGRATGRCSGRWPTTLAPATPVFQFPVVEFPEVPPVGGTQGYDPARAYLHAPSLRWSFGSVRGRHPDWPADLDERDGPALVEFLRDAGFRAVVVDRFGYPDRAADLEARLDQAATREGASADGRYVWYVL